MSKENKTIITIVCDVYASNEYVDTPACGVIYLTQEQLDKYKKISKVVKEHGAYSMNLWEGCSWFDHIPLYSFKDLTKYLFAGDICGEFSDEVHTDEDEDAELSFGSIGTELVTVNEDGFYFVAYGKHSGDKLETAKVYYKDLDKALAEPFESRAGYYFHERMYREEAKHPQPLSEAPKYINDKNIEVRHYYKELLKYGGDKEVIE